MNGIRVSRVLLGGIVAGIIIDICEGLISGVVLMDQWSAAMRALGREAGFSGTLLALLNVWGLLMGIAVVWLYAAIRPRFGPGPRTAVIAGLTMWFAGFLISTIPTAVMGLFPPGLLAASVGLGLIEMLLAALAGAALYREEAEPKPELRANEARA